MGHLYIGLDASTQSLSAVVIDPESGETVYRDSVGYDRTLPAYGTVNGVLQSSDPQIAHAPPLMWVEALDVLFERMRAGIDPGAVACICGSGQQHGSVYLNASATEALCELSPSRSLADNLGGIFSRPTSPIWMDSSTGEECAEIMDALGGMRATAEATGSRAFERFTGPQIRKFYKTDPENYRKTQRIDLVSSFMASVIAGQPVPVDHGDGAGMNLMDIRTGQWHSDALNATAPGLKRRLPPLAPSDTSTGRVSRYFVEKYGLNPEARAMVWSGDNPNSIIGLGLVNAGMTGISLGTSDTYFGFMKECRTDPDGEGHVFGAPTGDYMSLIVFQNGSLAREKVRDRYGLGWSGFSRALEQTPAGNNGKIMLPYFSPEIVPRVCEPGVRRFDLDENDVAGNCRAVVEAQMMAMRIHSQWMGRRPSGIYATGGASENEAILRIMADVHGCPVYRFEVTNSAALGAALRAWHGHLKSTGRDPDWEKIVARFAEPVPGSKLEPDPAASAIYENLVEKYRRCERDVAGTGQAGKSVSP